MESDAYEPNVQFAQVGSITVTSGPSQITAHRYQAYMPMSFLLYVHAHNYFPVNITIERAMLFNEFHPHKL